MAYFRTGKIGSGGSGGGDITITLYGYAKGSGSRGSADYTVSTSLTSSITFQGASKITVSSGSLKVNDVTVNAGESMDLDKTIPIEYKVNGSASGTKSSSKTLTTVFTLSF